MKIATFSVAGERKVGVVDEAGASVAPYDLSADQARQGILHLVELQAEGRALPATGAALALADIRLEAPLPRPRRNIFCVGKNYYDHAQEFAGSGFDSSAAKGAVPEYPIVFSKVPESVIGTDACIAFDPQVSSAMD